MEAKRKIVHVMWGAHIGGIERYVHDLALEQRSHGLDPQIAIGEDDGFRARSLRDAGIPVLGLGLRSTRDLHPKRLRNAARILRDADIIHLHNFNLALGTIAASVRNTPVVYTEHIPLALTSKMARKARSWFLRGCADSVVAVSGYTASFLSRELHLGAVTTIHNGSRFPPEMHIDSKDGSKPLRMTYVGRLSDWKRVDRALDGLAAAASRDSIEFSIVGDGPMRPALQRQVMERGLGGRVKFLGYVEDVERVLASSDVLVLPSQGEPFGLVVLEATAQGALPIVFSDGGGACEALHSDGIIVADHLQLGSALDALQGSPLLSRQSRTERALWVRSSFSIERSAEQYLDVYRNVLAS